MPSIKATAAVPMTTGVFLAGTAARAVAQHGLELWTTLALAGSLSAVAVGLSVLTGRSEFEPEDDIDGYRERTTVALASLALTSVAVGAGIALA